MDPSGPARPNSILKLIVAVCTNSSAIAITVGMSYLGDLGLDTVCLWKTRKLFGQGLAQGEGDEGFAVELVGGVVGFVAGGDRFRDRGIKFASGDLVRGGMGVAELAMGEVAFFGAGRWTEGAAEDRPVLVEIAGAGSWIEDWAGLVVGKVLEGFGCFFIFGEDAGDWVAGKARRQAGEGRGYPGAYSRGSGWVRCCEEFEADAEADRVLVRDGEDAVAALGASGAASQVRAAAEGGGGEGGVDDLDEVGHDWPVCASG